MRLDCPLCGAVVTDGPEPVPGECPGCGARFLGGDASPQDVAATLVAALDLKDVDAGCLARALFDIDPAQDPDAPVAITSDRRDEFYRWWVFVAATSDASDRIVALLG